MHIKSVLAAALTVMTVAPEVHATFFLGRWGCDFNLLDWKVKKICTVKNAFGCKVPAFGGLCSSDRTRVPPKGGVTCPKGWFQHYEKACCVPTHVDQDCRCPDGHDWDDHYWRCNKKRDDKSCERGHFWHHKLGCCPSTNPPKGNCPDGECPSGWYWNTKKQKCYPSKPDCPEPTCSGWDWIHCKCKPPPKPSKGYNKPPQPKPTHGHGWWWKKDQAAFPVSEFDQDNCPAELHACPVTGLDGEAGYECIDFATELESCGGCASTGAGVDCTALPYADSVGCEAGVCQIFSCQEGFAAVNGTSCVAI